MTMHVAENRLRPPQLLLAVFTILLVIIVGLSAVYRAAWDDMERTDYTVYRAAGAAVLAGSDIYAAHNIRGWNYVYPPPFALLMAPLAKISVAAGVTLWYLLEIAAIAATSLMSVALLGPIPPDRQRTPLYALPLLCIGVLLVSIVMRCQASIFMIALVTGSVYLHFRGRPVMAGLSLALAALLKVFPILLLIYFMAQRQWRAVVATFGGLAVFGILLPSLAWGWQKNVDLIERWVDVVGRPALMSNAERASATPLYDQLLDARIAHNESLEALFLSAGAEPKAAQYLAATVGGLMLALMLLISRHLSGRTEELALCGAFLLWLVLIPPISETHYFGLLILPLTVIIAPLSQQHDRRHLTTLVLLMIGVTILSVWNRSAAVMRPLCLASLLIWAALVVPIFQRRFGAKKNSILQG